MRRVISLLFLFTVSSLKADLFPFTPPEDFVLDPRLIALHHPVSTENIAAQLYFDQGLTLLYAFNHDAAYWSFLRASQSDSNLAMAYWGMALAMGKNINMDITDSREKKAFDLVSKALSLKQYSSDSEKSYIEALSTRYSHDSQDRNALAEKYKNAMKEVAARYPDDPDASSLYAESILDTRPWDQWTLSGQPKEGTIEAIQALESVLKRDPQHLGANHYYIHVMEASAYPERALTSAMRLSALLPSSGHILHMPSHIYILVGDYEKAALCNEQAIVADRDYIKKYGLIGIYPVHYLTHNYYFLSRAYSMQGRYEAARSAALALTAFYLPHVSHMPELEYYLTAPFFVDFRFSAWQSLTALPPPPKDRRAATALWHFARSYAFFKEGREEQGRKEKKAFYTAASEMPQELEFGLNKASKVIGIAKLLLASCEKQREGDQSGAITLLERAVAEQDTMRYNEPPDWFFPIREMLGMLYLGQKDFEKAEGVFRADLNRHPRNGRSLFGLWKSLQGQGRLADAYFVEREFNLAWQYSEVKPFEDVPFE